ncbi:prolipoprotein diacylglyceryl transferase family protein [Pseudomonas sp. NPDC090202]|uniref:prolipoprotein diacylglyceryl transferase family protein n=1 Tax=unclassified Pseudomonas TaxID=196821 RepID=UPI0038127861
MLSLSLGPFALAINHLLLLMALAVATLVGWLSGRARRINPERTLFSLFIVGLLIARLAFVIAYWTQYRDNLLHIVDIRDGGFLPWAGVVAVLIGWLLLAWQRPALRKALGLAVLSGLLFWGLTTAAFDAQQAKTRLPELTLRNAAGEPVRLHELVGKPLVINLWATWCPPCRREMPVLAAAQQAHPEVTFLFVNQAESPRDVATFLTAQGLHLDNLLFDDSGELAKRIGSAALPTTLFYQPDGRLLGSHLGQLSSASLKQYLDGLSDIVPSSVARSTP